MTVYTTSPASSTSAAATTPIYNLTTSQLTTTTASIPNTTASSTTDSTMASTTELTTTTGILAVGSLVGPLVVCRYHTITCRTNKNLTLPMLNRSSLTRCIVAADISFHSLIVQ